MFEKDFQEARHLKYLDSWNQTHRNLQQRALKTRKRAGKSPFELSPDDLMRRFRFEKEIQVNETYSYTVTKEQTMELLDKYVAMNLRDSADMDPNDYSILKGTDF